MNTSNIITLTTDFGLGDAYVPAMKGVILAVNPGAKLVDLTHLSTLQDPMSASFSLQATCPYFPKGTIHLVVIDPGVGTQRRPIAVASQGHLFVGPDNGLFSDFLDQDAKVYELTNKELFIDHLTALTENPFIINGKPHDYRISKTFHGRDIFAPVAAHLSLGLQIEKVGNQITDPVKIKRPEPVAAADRVVGQVFIIDRFGNLITNIPENIIPADPLIRIQGKAVQGLSSSYEEAKPGQLLAIIGSSDLLEISLPNSSAADALGVFGGDLIEVEILSSPANE